MITWTRPDGSNLETNDMSETIKYCESLGWNRSDKKASPKKKAAKKVK